MKVSFGGRIRDLAAKLGKEEQDIAADLGLSKSQMSHYINGRRKVPSELLQDIVNKYKINPQFLFDKNAPLYVSTETTKQYNYLPTVISAGLPINVEGITESDKISIPDTVMGKWAGHKDIFITKINGDSMDKVMPDGSLIAVKPITLDRLRNGDMVVFSNNHEYSVKYYYRYGKKIVFKPSSNNPEHFEQHYTTDDDIQIHGKVVVYIVELD